MISHWLKGLYRHETECTVLGIVFFIAIFLAFPQAQAAELETETVSIPVQVEKYTYYDDARITKPVGDGPFPLVVLNHGTPRDAQERAQTDVNTYFKYQSEYFAKRGYAVIFVVRRGFGNSIAPYAENQAFANGTRNYTQSGLEAAKDIKAAINYMKDKTYVDGEHIILVGQSTGGHSVIATGSLGIPGVIGIINFAGGRGSYGPDLVRDEKNLIDSMGRYGQTSRVPTLWLYALNDHYFRPDLAQAMFKAYTDHGGQAKFITLPPYGDDGHRSFVGNRAVWSPYIEQFLADLKE